MRLEKILSGTKYISSNCSEDIEINSIEYNSAAVKQNDIFVCIKGFSSDGHKYIEDAKNKGAVLVVITEDVNTFSLPYIKVKDAREFMADAANIIYDFPFKKLKVIGVTGTNGKTTTTHLIKSVFDFLDVKAGMIGTNEIVYGDTVIESERTTPEAPKVQYYLSEMVKSGMEYCVMEVSSHSIELKRVFGMEFECAVFTNLTHEHLDFHGNMENYMRAKTKLFSMCKKAVINLDDTFAEAFLEKCSRIPLVTYGIERNADIKAENWRLSEKGVIYNISAKGEPLEIKLAIPGKFSIYNSLAAFCCCMLLDIPVNDIVKSLRMAKGVKGRAEFINVPVPFKVIIDYAHTPDGLTNILSAIREFTSGRIITVFGSAGDRDKEKRGPMGTIVGRNSDFCIITTDNPAFENNRDILKQIASGVIKSGCRHFIIEDREEAIKCALNEAKPGDVVLLAGKGHENYQIIGKEKIYFSEREIVKKFFEEKSEK